jgi:GTP cyclohydrolase I
MARAVRDFLGAAGLPRTGELAATPRRVAEAWSEEFLDGYQADPERILAEVHPTRSRELVVAKGLDFHSMCPHHLLPYRGLAHVGYLPEGAVVGFGRLGTLVDCFAHRLVLQEEIADEVTDALMAELGAAGAACLLDAEQSCMTMRGSKRRGARTITRSFKGRLAKDPRLQRQFLEAIRA